MPTESSKKLRRSPDKWRIAPRNFGYMEMIEDDISRRETLEETTEWQTNNLEYDLRTADWIKEKCKSNTYCQNLYAALCNNEFQRILVEPILFDQRWSCSWRHAGGIVADILETGDYIDWYCSGMQVDYTIVARSNETDPTREIVPEGTVTTEIRNDLDTLGWAVL